MASDSQKNLPFLKVRVSASGKQNAPYANILALKDSACAVSMMDLSTLIMLGIDYKTDPRVTLMPHSYLIAAEGSKSKLICKVRLQLTFGEEDKDGNSVTMMHDFLVTGLLKLGYRVILGADIVQNNAFKMNETCTHMLIRTRANGRRTHVRAPIYYIEKVKHITPTLPGKGTTIFPRTGRKIRIEKIQPDLEEHVISPYKGGLVVMDIRTHGGQSMATIFNVTNHPIVYTKSIPGAYVSLHVERKVNFDEINSMIVTEAKETYLASPDINTHDQMDIANLINDFAANGMELSDFYQKEEWTDEELLKQFHIDHLDKDLQEKIKALVLKHKSMWSYADKIGTIPNYECEVPSDGKPFIDKRRPIASHKIPIFEEYCKRLLAAGIIEEVKGSSPYVSNVFIIDKKQSVIPGHEETLGNNPVRRVEDARFIFDSRSSNGGRQRAVANIGDIRSAIHDILTKIEGNVAVLDITSFFFHIVLKESSRAQFTFYGPKSQLYRFTRLVQGCDIAPHVACTVLGKLLMNTKTVSYIDDILVYADTPDMLIEELDKVFTIFVQNDIKLKPKKCQLWPKKMEVLGFLLEPTMKKISIPEMKIKHLLQIPQPKSRKDVQKFLGGCGYYTAHLPYFSQKMNPIIKLSGKTVKFTWGEEQKQAFQWFKDTIQTDAERRYPSDQYTRYNLYSDASNIAACHCLTFIEPKDGKEYVLGYSSKTFNKTSLAMASYHKEMSSVIIALTMWWLILQSAKCLYVYTDCKSITGLGMSKDTNVALTRLAIRLSHACIPIHFVHVPGVGFPIDAHTRMRHQQEIAGKTRDKQCIPITIPETEALMKELYIPTGHVFSPEDIRKLLARAAIPSSIQKKFKCACKIKQQITSEIFESEPEINYGRKRKRIQGQSGTPENKREKQLLPVAANMIHVNENARCFCKQASQAITELEWGPEMSPPTTVTFVCNPVQTRSMASKTEEAEPTKKVVTITDPQEFVYRKDTYKDVEAKKMSHIINTIISGFMHVKAFIDLQKEDTFCADLIQKCKNYQTELDPYDKDPEVGQCTRGSSTYLLRHGVLFLQEGKEIKLIVPRVVLDLMVNSAHNPTLHTEHPGPVVLYNTMRRKYYYPSMQRRIKEIADRCIICKLSRSFQVTPHPERNILSQQPSDSLHMDYITRLPEDQGYTNILVFTDGFSSFTQVFPTKTRSYEEFLFWFRYGWLQTHSKPTVIRIDQERAFLAEEVMKSDTFLGIEVIPISSGHSQSNSTVELIVKKLKTHCAIAARTSGQTQSWLSVLPDIVLSINAYSTIHGYSPFYLQTGREPNGVEQPVVLISKCDNMEVALTRKRETLVAAWEEYAESKMEAMKKRVEDARHVHLDFQVGDRVLVRANEVAYKKIGRTRYHGLYVITDMLHPHTALLKRMDTGTIIQKHTSQLRKWKGTTENLMIPPHWDKSIEESLAKKGVRWSPEAYKHKETSTPWEAPRRPVGRPPGSTAAKRVALTASGGKLR